MTVLRIPEPSLVVLVGAAGSGKSTLAARWFAPDEILSSDAMRGIIAGDPADQRASRHAFAMLQRALDRRLAAHLTAVVDATSTTAQARRPLLASARRAGVPTVAIVLDLPPADVHARNAQRTERVVDPTVVDRHLAAVRRTIDGEVLATEGFERVMVLRSSAAIERVIIERDPVNGGSAAPDSAARDAPP